MVVFLFVSLAPLLHLLLSSLFSLRLLWNNLFSLGWLAPVLRFGIGDLWLRLFIDSRHALLGLSLPRLNFGWIIRSISSFFLFDGLIGSLNFCRLLLTAPILSLHGWMLFLIKFNFFILQELLSLLKRVGKLLLVAFFRGTLWSLVRLLIAHDDRTRSFNQLSNKVSDQ